MCVQMKDIEKETAPAPETAPITGRRATRGRKKTTLKHDLDEDGIDPDAEAPTTVCGLSPQVSVIIIRLGVMAIAIALIWVTSLNAANAFVDYTLPAPPPQLITDSWSKLVCFFCLRTCFRKTFVILSTCSCVFCFFSPGRRYISRARQLL